MIARTLSHYRVIAPLRRGEMGVVFKAEDTILGRAVAIKMQPSELADRPHAVGKDGDEDVPALTQARKSTTH